MTERKLSTPIVIVVSLLMILSLTLCPTPAVAPPIKYTITVTQGANGHIDPGTTNVDQGHSQTFTITPSKSYSIASLIVDGSPVVVASSYTFSNVQASHTITATFAIGTYTITVNQDANGQITPGTTNVNYGASQSFTITPSTGYYIASLIVDGSPVEGASSYTFSNVQASHTITATFSINRYTITVNQDANGHITPGTTTVNYGASQTFTITPSNGYSIASLIIDGSPVTIASSYTFNNVQAPHTIAATFSTDTDRFTITVTQGANGQITPGTTNVNYGASQTFTITANNGYYIASLIVDGSQVAVASSYTFSYVQVPHTITATFAIGTTVAQFTESATTVNTGVYVQFDASASYDPKGTITGYYWNFGDGSNATGIVTSHSYAKNGTYTVALTVTNNDRQIDSQWESILVHDRPPIASFITSSETVYTNDVVIFNATASYDPDGTIVSYFWDFGDETNATGVVVNHVYSQPSNCVVTLTVTDDDGASNATSVDVIIIDVFPVASFTTLPSQPKPGDAVTFNAESSYDPNGTIMNYRWDFGDGNITETDTAIVTHTYLGYGDFNVTLTVLDDKNLNDSTSSILSVQVHNVAVISVVLSATEVQIGQTLNITVKVNNNGTAPESFIVTVFSNETTIANQTVTLLPAGADQVLVFHWNTSNVAKAARYLIQAKASNVTDENDLADNIYNGGVVNIVRAQSNGSSLGPTWAWAMPVFLGFAIPFAAVAWKRRKRGENSRDFDYFDEITGGGIPDSFSVLVIGGPGSGKSILCQELAYAFLTKGKMCLYVTYDCFPGEIRDNLKKFNQDISTYEAKKSFLFLDCYSSVAKTESKEEYALGQPFSLGDLGITLSETMGEMRAPERVIFDSIVPLLTHVDPWKVIEFLQDRSARVKGVNGTLVFSVGKETIESSLANRLEEVVDCIIELDVSEKKGKTVRNLRIKKMSGRKTSDKWIEFEIDPAKGIVFPI